MLTEADMIRIMAEKYRLAESVGDAFIDNETRNLLNTDELFGMHEYEITYPEVNR